jgi:hypothetical protein
VSIISLRALGAATCAWFVLLARPLAGTAAAQEQSRLVVEFEAGGKGFADDGIVSEAMVGSAARWVVSPRISIGPEVVYVNSSGHSHLMVTGNVTYDVLPLIDRRPRAVTPFLLVGGGLFRTRETLFRGDFISTEGACTAGGGVRALAGDRITIGIDTRVGWELHLRVNGFIGLRFAQ